MKFDSFSTDEADRPEIEWGFALAIALIRVLDRRVPGLMKEVQSEVLKIAETAELDADPNLQMDAAHLRSLSKSDWFLQPTAGSTIHALKSMTISTSR